MLKAANLALLLLYPVAWAAPLMRAGLLPLFGLHEISLLSGVAALWQSDSVLAVLVALLALVLPWVKTLALTLVQFARLPRALLPWLGVLNKLAMADVFLVAIYITLAKGLGVGRIETAWGLYLFTCCVLASLALSWAEGCRR
ncbi:Paraquat-inducible protein A [Salipiger aestuarii]|uniref:Paraquat-inducible protein A n=1 Tax=Salipiger aestuarii TaxID=568098 RepID=A0A327YFM2_9RHOB|nr:paraquat-inducible protein A [Salipiger aestuarii]EIE50918.1 paraquat-inducible protein A [Citreicella sp. 357]KAA8607403.1 Paraquat-inducible protein A [Salipiger aestuarii]KAA8612111.1 Paraquat-inducible protein A [Salipiger aestuarii]KAB2541744.1 Paraquat-inducible protein A [Salipiger aestuarii]RAK17259.1 paraquat-inducible protein A [Salipiger aestuarii]